MTYRPGGSGYPPGQQPTRLLGPRPSRSARPTGRGPRAAAGPSKLPFYLLRRRGARACRVLFSFGPPHDQRHGLPQLGSASGTSLGLGLAVLASLFAGLFAGASLLPKQKVTIGVVAAVSVLGFLLVIAEIINKPDGVSIGWALYVVIALTFLQAAVAIGALLLDAGIISAPVPRPKYEQPQYGQYGAPGQYYGQQPHQLRARQQQRPGYPAQYGGYPGGSSSGGYSAGQQSGPPTPPTGFPTYGQPQAAPSASTGQVPAQPQSSPSSNQSGNSPPSPGLRA